MINPINIEKEDYSLYVKYDNNRPYGVRVRKDVPGWYPVAYNKIKTTSAKWHYEEKLWIFNDSIEAQNYIDYFLSGKRKEWKLRPLHNKYCFPEDTIKYSNSIDDESVIVFTPSSAIAADLCTFRGAIKKNDEYVFILDKIGLKEFIEENTIQAQEIKITDKLIIKLKSISLNGWSAWFEVEKNDSILYRLFQEKLLFRDNRGCPIHEEYQELSYYEMCRREPEPLNIQLENYADTFMENHLYLNRGEIETHKNSTFIALMGYDDLLSTPMAQKIDIDVNKIPGYHSAVNGNTMYDYQKKCVDFFAEKGGKMLLADDMGSGKTVQAIACANAVEAKNIIIIVPPIAKYVWKNHIDAWNFKKQNIKILSSSKEYPDQNCRWNIVSYEMFDFQSATLDLIDSNDLDEFKKIANLIVKKNLGHKNKEKLIKKYSPTTETKRMYPSKFDVLFDTLDVSNEKIKYLKTKTTLILDEYIDYTPTFKSIETLEKYSQIMTKLSGEYTERFRNLKPDMIIFDEAHKIKNPTLKRTKELSKLAYECKYVLPMTGTPIRNREDEAHTILQLLDAKLGEYDTKSYLLWRMLRRNIKEILPELPIATREKWPIQLSSPESIEYIDLCHKQINFAEEQYYKALEKNIDPIKAGKIYLSGIKKAAKYAGIAKVVDGQIADNIIQIAEERESCLVFVEHHDVGDILQKQLKDRKIKTVRVDGRTSAKDKKKAEEDFQNGIYDVFIGGTLAAGESLTMTRSHVVCFVEFNWVPGAMIQAERRGLRIGQKSDKYFVIYYIAEDLHLDNTMMRTLIKKCDLITKMLDDDFSLELEKDILSEQELIELLLTREKNEESIIKVPIMTNIDNTSSQIRKNKWILTEENFQHTLQYIEESLKKGKLLINISLNDFQKELANISDIKHLDEFNKLLQDYVDIKSINKLRDAIRSKKSKHKRAEDLKQITISIEAWKILSEITQNYNMTLSQAIFKLAEQNNKLIDKI